MNYFEFYDIPVAFLLDEKASPISGFIGHLAKENQKKSLLFGYENFGYGKVIYFVDNPLFRGFWYNGKQIFSNALFFLENRVSPELN